MHVTPGLPYLRCPQRSVPDKNYGLLGSRFLLFVGQLSYTKLLACRPGMVLVPWSLRLLTAYWSMLQIGLVLSESFNLPWQI